VIETLSDRQIRNNSVFVASFQSSGGGKDFVAFICNSKTHDPPTFGAVSLCKERLKSHWSEDKNELLWLPYFGSDAPN
jgi:hypothetical protein